jgi:hypothetical protein
VYDRPEVLSHMLQSARKTAIANIAVCQAEGVPCVAAIAQLQSADMSRDDREEDPVDVLVLYWNASLQAQALQMLFSSGGQTR